MSRYRKPTPSPFFLRLVSNTFLDFGSVGRLEKKGRQKKSGASLPWRLETTRHGYKVIETEEEIDTVVKFQQKHGKKDEPQNYFETDLHP